MQRARERFQSTPSVGRATGLICGGIQLGIISIHALREEGDLPTIRRGSVGDVFQSTPSARRATIKLKDSFMSSDISIHALREEGDLSATFLIVRSDYFNPRPPRGGRRDRLCSTKKVAKFQSTPSARRATAFTVAFSIAPVNFNPRPPRGGRPNCPTFRLR